MKIAHFLREKRAQIVQMWQRLWKKNFRPQAAAGSQQPGTAPLPLEQMGERFLGFWQRYRSHFQGATRSVEQQAWQYLKGLLQSVKRNIERMVEKVPEADYQAQQHFVTYSPWRHQAVLEQVAAEANQLLGGDRDRGLILDESGFPKQGKKSVGVARQWCGNLGKVDNCQVAVYAALSCRQEVTLVDERLYLPEAWSQDPQRCEEAGIPLSQRVFHKKTDLALAMIGSLRQRGVRFQWTGFDSFYGSDPAFLRALDEAGEIFVGDVHKDQHIYLQDPRPFLPLPAPKGRKPSRWVTEVPAWRVDHWVAQQPEAAWQKVRLRESTRGYLEVEILHRRVWVWDGQETQARQWHVIVRREIQQQQEIKYSLSNAAPQTKPQRLAFMQNQRYWVERALQNGKSEVGLADYQVRQWQGWHHHMALCLMAMLFMLEERRQQQTAYPLLSCYDIKVLLQQLLPQRDVTLEEVLRQMHWRHQQRQQAITWAYRNQQRLLVASNTS